MSFITKLFRKEKAAPPSELHGAMSAEQARVEQAGQASVRKALDAALDFQFKTYPADAALVAFGAAILFDKTREERYRAFVARTLQYLDDNQNRTQDPTGRGQIGWSEWGVNNAEAAKGTGRPPQFLGQARPLTPGFTLAYAQPAAAILE